MNPAEVMNGGDRIIDANHLNGLAAVHEKRHEYEEAERLYEEALTIFEEIFGTKHLTTALVTKNLARVLRIQGKTAEASLLDDHASDILTRRGEGEEASKAPFGGSSGFFELMGTVYTKLEPQSEAVAGPAVPQPTDSAD